MGRLSKFCRAIPALAIAGGLIAATINCYATSTTHTMKKTESKSFYQGKTGVYHIEVGYDYGSGLPFDDAGLWAKSGTKPFYYREACARFTGMEPDYKKTYSAIGRGVDTIEAKVVYSGVDYATGTAYARTYDTYTSSASVTNLIALKVMN